MKLIISLITTLSFIALLGCNTNNNQSERATTTDSYSAVDITEQKIFDDINTRTDLNQTSASEEANVTEDSESASSTYTEAEMVEEVVMVDTVATNIAYDVNRRTIEQVDTVGATKTYEVKRKIIKKKILVDTVTETVSKEQQVEFEKGNYKVLNEKVVRDTVNERIEHTTSSSPAKSNPAEDQNVQLQLVKSTNPNNPAQLDEMESPEQKVEVEQLSEKEIEASSTEANMENERKAPSYEPVQSDTTETSEGNS
ncbi:hypothetical protein [Tunicatimonas pelagia]|uniref:hypothetical protein n=1 Tax=Tunicatimonas pelagia TaxID=931531 RepID=UPI00266663F0|nr:hypothetical protein [Tunicatimonas pelagia]WKN40637.1 hypothetical protein P0M28_16485 [Tunicatimonas pelagia]